MDKALYRCSRLSDLMTGLNILSSRQLDLLATYSERAKGIGKPLTDNQLIEYGKLLEKKSNTEISDSAKKFVLSTYLKNEYNYEEVLVTDTLLKGIKLESEAIALVSLFEGVFYKKNKERKKNDFIIGELDVKATDHIKDIKISKNIQTFYEVSDVKKMYYWQAQGYMWLWGINKYSLTYVLMPDDDDMIERQLSRLSYNLVGSDYEMAAAQIRHNNQIITKLPLHKRIKTFEFEFNPDDIDLLKLQIERANIYYQTIKIEEPCQA